MNAETIHPAAPRDLTPQSVEAALSANADVPPVDPSRVAAARQFGQQSPKKKSEAARPRSRTVPPLHQRAARWALALLVLALFACEREKRDLHPPVNRVEASEMVQTNPVRAGGPMASQTPKFADENIANAVAQGKQLYVRFNCANCHAYGGGDIGPPLKDNVWIYGSDPAQIYASIVQGRPNGMPSYRGRIAEDQLWKIVAYVRSQGGLAPSGTAPGRDDDIKVPPENTQGAQTPVQALPNAPVRP